MHSRITACLIPLSILFITTEKCDGLPRKSSSSRKTGANLNSEQNSVQKKSGEISASPHSVKPRRTGNNLSKNHQIDQAESLFKADEFKLAETSSSERNATTPTSTPKKLSGPWQKRSESTKLRKSFAQILMSNTSEINDQREEEVVQKKDPVSPRTPESDEQWSPGESYPKITDQGTTSAFLSTNFEGVSLKREEAPLNTEKPITTEPHEECLKTNEDGLKNSHSSETVDSKTTDPLLEKATIDSESVAIVNQMVEHGTDEKKKGITYSNLTNIPTYDNIRFGSFDLVDYEKRYKVRKDRRRVNDQLKEELSAPPRRIQTQNKVNKLMLGEGSSSGNVRSLSSRSETIDSDVFEIDINNGKAIAPSTYDKEADDDLADLSLIDGSENYESNWTLKTKIHDSNAKNNEISYKSGEPDGRKMFENIDRKGTEVGDTREKCFFLQFALEKRVILVVPDQSKPSNVFDEIQAMDIDLDDFDIIYKKVYRHSGAVLFKCRTEEDTRNLCKVVAESENLKVMSKSRAFDHVVRVYNIPKETTREELSFAVRLKYGEIPKTIHIVDRECSIGNGRIYQKVAIMRVTKSLWKKIRKSPGIRIRWIQYEIDASLDVLRCHRCYCIGHMLKDCNVPPRLARPPPASWSRRCLDCKHYNMLNIGNRRDEQHSTNAEHCPTKMAYLLGKGQL